MPSKRQCSCSRRCGPGATAGIALRVRCGLHAGVVERRDNDFFGTPVNRAARIMASRARRTGAGVAGGRRPGCRALPAGVALRDLGAVRLRDLASPEHVFQVVHPQLRQDFPALRSLEATPNNLPQQVTSFIGRERELAEVRQLLGRTRLLTLLGVGRARQDAAIAAGGGRRAWTTIPTACGSSSSRRSRDARSCRRPWRRCLASRRGPGDPCVETLPKYVRDRRLLLILDNCEHLLQRLRRAREAGCCKRVRG